MTADLMVDVGKSLLSEKDWPKLSINGSLNLVNSVGAGLVCVD